MQRQIEITKALQDLRSQRRITPGALKVARALLNSEYTFPTYSVLMDICALSKDSVWQAVRTLEALKILRIIPESGPNNANIYAFNKPSTWELGVDSHRREHDRTFLSLAALRSIGEVTSSILLQESKEAELAALAT